MGNLTAHFDKEEFYCKCGNCSPVLPKMEMINVLEKVRTIVNRPIRVTCGIRCQAHNQALGGAIYSRHVPLWGGDAVDLACNDSSERHELVAAAIQAGAMVIEVAANHVHLDMRPGPYKLILGDDH